jgi:hypothetical protein
MPTPNAWFGFAAAVLVLHWVLLFGWGLMLNDTACGYLYCRLAMPGPIGWSVVPWAFSTAGIVLIFTLSIIDRRLCGVSTPAAVVPVVAFLITQMFAYWLNITGIRS